MGGHLVGWLMDRWAPAALWSVVSPLLLGVAEGGLQFCSHTTSHRRLAVF